MNLPRPSSDARTSDPLARVPLHALRGFDTVARHRDYAAAAKELGVSVSALSHQIRKLEAILGATLVVSTGKRFALSPNGLALARSLEVGFSHIRCGLADFGCAGRLRLAMCPLLAGLLAPRIATIERAVGEALDLHLTPLPKLTPDGGVDAAIALTPAEASADLSIEICNCQAAPVAFRSVGEALRQSGPVVWLTCTHWMDAFDQWRAAAGVAVERSRTVSADGLASLHAACLQGAGIAILPVELIRSDLRSGRLLEVFPGVTRLPVSFAMSFSQEPSHAHRMQRLGRALANAANAALDA